MLATHLRHRFYPDVDPSRIDWFDVFPPDVYRYMTSGINAVTMKHANGVYSKPSWGLTNADIPEDWAAFINKVIARGKAADSAAEAAPHDDTAKKSPVAR